MATPSGEAPATSADVSFTTALGKLAEFNPEESSLSAYLERVHIFFVANSIPESKQVPVFLNAIGATTYSVLTHCPSTFGNDQLLLRNTSKHDYQGLSWLLPASCFVEEKVGIPYMVVTRKRRTLQENNISTIR